MREFGREKTPISAEKIVKEQDSQKKIEGKKIEISEEEEKRVGEIVNAYDKNRKNFGAIEKIKDGKERRKSLIKLAKEIFSELPTIEPGSLEKILKGVIKEYESKETKYGVKKEYEPNLGLVPPSVINRTADYGGAKYSDKEDFKKLKISLNTSRLEKRLNFLGYGNRPNVEQVIVGDVGHNLAFGMDGGRITVVGNAGKEAGKNKKGGEVLIIGNIEGLGERPEDKGTMWQVAPRKQEKS
ncbi:hypothetical protein KJ636_03645 [Patescibacteria group bacterium]|nr:hypothetical protein [Patescibacteria group bacterium]